jgi:hypothetical protein
MLMNEMQPGREDEFFNYSNQMTALFVYFVICIHPIFAKEMGKILWYYFIKVSEMKEKLNSIAFTQLPNYYLFILIHQL